MTLYGFRDKRTAENLKQFGETLRFNRTQKITRSTGSETLTAKIAEGIAAVDGAGKRSSGTAVVVQFDGTGDKVETNTEITVFNSTSEALSVDDLVQVVREGAKWTTVVGGGGGGGTINYLCKAPIGGVPARTGDNASQTDCDTYEINASSGLISATGSTINVYNIWSQGIASNAYFTTQVVDGLNVPDAEDCTGN